MDDGNLFIEPPFSAEGEVFDTLLETPSFKLEKILSSGQASPPGQWYDQDTNEWVVLLRGSAGLLFEGETTAGVLGPGDHLLIPAHCRHRVEWTDPKVKTVWLALHYRSSWAPG